VVPTCLKELDVVVTRAGVAVASDGERTDMELRLYSRRRRRVLLDLILTDREIEAAILRAATPPLSRATLDEAPAGRERLRIPAPTACLGALLAAIGFPDGYAIDRRGRVLRLRRSCRGSDTLDVLQTTWTRRALDQRLCKALADFSQEYRRCLAASLGRQLPTLTSTRLLYEGRSVSVSLEDDGRLSLRRRLRPWSLGSGRTRRSFPKTEISISFDYRPRRGVATSGVHLSPHIVHSFVHGGQICLDDYSPRDRSWARRGFKLLQRAEEVLVLPKNAREGGFVLEETPRRKRGGDEPLRELPRSRNDLR
jgi:hypothetical protein